MDRQIANLREEIIPELQRNIVGDITIEGFLAKSLFYSNIGSNDYLTNYLYPPSYEPILYPVPAYRDHLIEVYTAQLKELHNLGARKFLISGLAPFGCIPFYISIFSRKNDNVEAWKYYPCSDIHYAGESNGSQRSSGTNIFYSEELNGLEVSEIVPKGDYDAAVNGEWPSKDISSVHQGRVYESPTLDDEQNSFDSQQCSFDIQKQNTEPFMSSESLSPNAYNDWDEGFHFLETEWSEQDTAVAL
ncbi:hypothetical protein GIB67_021062 [Kingdonia uniflora]|uniref:GDSL esterase/lipase n=1 Tax=Kingdonia uniflora TaxID=39325 RepID=A0A7J7N753_9MAGN|nr:hypothetical protein GIB67_021062 [Kingdonia uniflora]